MFVLFIIDYIFITLVKPSWACYCLSLSNILLAFIQLLFEIKTINYKTPMNFFIVGTIIMIAHYALLISNNFLEKLLTILAIFSVKFFLHVMFGNDIYLCVVIIFFAGLVIYQEYKKEEISRFVFLLKIKEEEWGKICNYRHYLGSIID